MAYQAPTFVNDNPPALNATNMNNLANTAESIDATSLRQDQENVLSEGDIVIATDSSTVVEGLSGTGAVYATESGDPQFGTLPVSCGGTGATTLQGLKDSLSLTNAGFVIGTTAPTDTTKLWINPTTRTMSYYYNGAWVLIRGVYA